MKSSLLALAISAATLALPVASQAAVDDAGGFFVNGAVGQANFDSGIYKDNDFAFYGNIGYRWAISPAAAFGIEGGYTDFGSAKVKSTYSGLGLPKGQSDGWTLGLNGHFNFTPEWYISGRVGGYFADLKGSYFPSGLNVNPLSSNAVYVNGSSTDYYAGAGVGYDFSNNFSLGVNYDYYKASKNGLTLDPYLLSVSGEFRFR
jgi:OOP family OmpA-OmpF porin/outer membrane immunogenic protein